MSQPAQADLTGPLRHLRDAGLTTREIGARLNLSQSTVVRRLRDIAAQDGLVRRRQAWMVVMFTLLTASAVTIAIGVAVIAFSS